jgi:hypothetical protein
MLKNSVSERTALRYITQLGFQYKRYKQGVQYTDGHEREDVVQYRKVYLNRMISLEARHQPPPHSENDMPSWHAGDPTKTKKLVIIYHDESIFYANEGPSMGWHDSDGSRGLRPKGRGKGIMVSEDHQTS